MQIKGDFFIKNIPHKQRKRIITEGKQPICLRAGER